MTILSLKLNKYKIELHIRLGGTNEIECLLPFIIELTDQFAIEDFFCIRKISQQN